MSKRNFLITAFALNVILCLVVCVLNFADSSDDGKETKAVAEISEQAGDTTENVDNQETKDEQQTTKVVKPTTDSNMIYEKRTTQEVTTIVEQLNTDEDGNMIEGTTSPYETTKGNEETTTSMPVANGSSVKITSDCNVRSTPDVDGTLLGTAKGGSTYQVDSTKVTDYWVPILFDGNTWGYVSRGYCSFE